MKCLGIARPAWKKSLHVILIAWLCGFGAVFIGALYLVAFNIILDLLPFELPGVA